MNEHIAERLRLAMANYLRDEPDRVTARLRLEEAERDAFSAVAVNHTLPHESQQNTVLTSLACTTNENR